MKFKLVFASSFLFSLIVSGVSAGELSIDAMLKKTEKMALEDKKPGDPGNVNALAEEEKDNEYLSKTLKVLDTKLGREAFEARKKKDFNLLTKLYFDIHRYKEALGYNQQLLANQEHPLVRNGSAYEFNSRVCAMLGEMEAAHKASDQFADRVTRKWELSRSESLKKWLKALPKIKAEVEKQQRKVNENPQNGKSRWRLIDLYHRNWPRKLDELKSLILFRDAFPKSDMVKGGECQWRLIEVLWHFKIQDEALEMIANFRKAYPKHWAVKRGEDIFRLGRYYERLGQLEKAITNLEQVMRNYPKHWSNSRKDRDATWMEEYLLRLKRQLQGR
jgi:tetratricopeptide (TPR) repeat protein